jgi:ketosteroid isomerase-like protein
MSEENVEAVNRAIEAVNRRDIEAVLEEVDPEAEWPHPGFHVALGGEATVYRGHEGVRKVLQDLYELFVEVEVLVSEIRDLGDRIVVTGGLRGRGAESGADVTTPWGAVVEFKDGKGIRLSDYLDPNEALEAAGLSE